jgi:hypothetical protein
MAERIDVVRELRGANAAIASAYGSTFEGLVKSILVVEDLIDFLREADCNCREASDRFDAHTCRRCELLARIEP